MTLHVSQVARLDFSMELARSARKSRSRRGAAPHTESGSLGGVVQNRQVVNMPLNNRNTVTLAFLTPA